MMNFLKVIKNNNWICKAFNVLCSILFLVLTIRSINASGYHITIADEHVYYKQDMILLNIVLAVVLLAIIWAWRRILQNVKSDILVWVISVVMTVISIWWVGASATFPQGDQSILQAYAALMNSGEYTFIEKGSYLGRYIYQLGFVTLIRGLYRIFGNGNYQAVQYMNAFMVPIIVYCGFRIVRILSSANQKIEKIYLFMIMCYIPLYGYVPYVYGEMTSLAFSMLSAWLLLECVNRFSITKALLLGLFMGVAVQLKKNSLIVVIAFMIVIFFYAIEKSNKRILLLCCSLIIGIILCKAAVINGFYGNKIAEDNTTMPASAFMMMGTNSDTVNSGWYNYYTDTTYDAYEADSQKVDKKAKEDLMIFLKESTSNWNNRIAWWTSKMDSMWNVPMQQCLAMNNGIDVEKQSKAAEFIYFGKGNAITQEFMNIWQLLAYIAVLIMLQRKRNVWNKTWYYVLLIAMFGGFLFFMMWEAKSRFVFVYIVMLVPYVAIGINEMMELIANRLKGNVNHEKR